MSAGGRGLLLRGGRTKHRDHFLELPIDFVELKGGIFRRQWLVACSRVASSGRPYLRLAARWPAAVPAALRLRIMDWLYPLSGFAVGGLVGLTGMGGGSLMTPLLILLFGVHPLTAVGTDLVFAAATKTAGTLIHAKKGNVEWRVAGVLATGSVPATVLTIWILARLPKHNPTTAAIISISIGAALIVAAVAIFFRRRIRNYALERADNLTRVQYAGPITAAFGALLGVVVSLCSVGAGALGVAVLFFLYPKLPPVRVVGSDLAHAVPLTVVAGVGHWVIGTVDWSIVGVLLLGSLPGIYLGSHLSSQVSDRILFPALASMMLLIGLRLIAS
jgi:uncharacterized protein